MNKRVELNILTFSAGGDLFFALLALSWGLFANSQMIIFDGIYSLVSLLLTGIYFLAAKSMALGRNEKFPFGRAQMEPMVIIIQSIVLVIVCVKAFSDAVITLFSGGEDVSNLSAMIYGIIGTTGVFFCWAYVARTGKRKAPRSELIRTQGMEWLIDLMLSLAVLIGFLIACVIQYAGYWNYARYVDPLMLIIAVLFLVRSPIVSLIDSVRGLLIMAPDKTIYNSSKKAIKELACQKGFEDIILHLGKSGRELVYKISFVAKDPDTSCSIGEMDVIHREVKNRLENLFDNPLRLSVSFIHDKKLD